MDTLQIKSIIKSDKYLKKIPSSVIFEKELPSIIPRNHFYFVLTPNGKTKDHENSTVILGHWILIERLDLFKRNGQVKYGSVNYFDPYGTGPDSLTYQKIAGTALIHNLDVFINKRRTQLPGSVIFGSLIIYVSLLRARGYSYPNILAHKLSKSLRINAQTIVDIVNSLLPKKQKKVKRFSLDFL